MLQNKTAIITGASQGIGFACAKRFIEEGANVVLSDVNDEVGKSAAKTLGDKASYLHCDVRSSEQIQALFDATIEKFGRIDTVIANAGIVHAADILELKEEDFDRVIEINLKGVFLTGQIAARIMINQDPDEDDSRGTIINMSSVNAILTIPAIAPSEPRSGAVV